MKAIFPKSSLTLIDTVATLGLLFFLFMVGLELDLGEIRRSGRTALVVAVSGIALPFLGGLGVANLVRESLSLDTRLGPLVVFMGVPLSITAFPVLVRIMAERRLLGTSLGKVVVPAAAINDVCAWILLAVGVALSGPATGPATPAYVLLAGLAFVIFMLVVTRRFMEWVARRASAHEEVGEIYVCVAMVGVLLSGFATDAIGIHPLFGAFVFGLVVPKDGPFARSLTSKIEDFVTVLMLPLFFASSGLKTNLSSLSGLRSLGFLVLLVLIAGLGKISATVAVALSIRMPANEALAFGFLMSTKGLVELIVLNIGKDLGVRTSQT
jgi:Kef-type K+ transport system membrane component KefB